MGMDQPMALLPMPTSVIDDADVACALSRAVRVINPVVDVLSGADPFGLKGRSHYFGAADGSVDKALDALAWFLNTADVPGTPGMGGHDPARQGQLVGATSGRRG